LIEQIPDHRQRHNQQHAHDDATADAVQVMGSTRAPGTALGD
jgi:hypothetical protein